MNKRLATAAVLGLLIGQTCLWGQSTENLEDRVRGMLLGSLIGDAAGGPPEFKGPEDLKKWLPDVRSWTADEFRAKLKSGELAREFKLLPYAGIRDEVAPYGPWEAKAPAGTVTDDSRHKMIFMNAIRPRATNRSATSLTRFDLCRAYVNFADTAAIRKRDDYVQLCDESLREYNSAARWIMGQRDPSSTFPPQRLWAGIATCSGQMTLLPVAAIYPGDPDSAYRASYALNFVDVGQALDICSALVAGLATGVNRNDEQLPDRWQHVFQAMRDTDPYRYSDVPFARRPATEWLDFAFAAAARADGSPVKLFEILEQEGRPKYYWDAHFTYACAIAFLKFCDYRPRESMLVSLAFGHDTDSVAQLIGALAGAVQGSSAFPAKARRQVSERLAADYGQDIEEWTRVLVRLSDRKRFPAPIQFPEQRGG